MSHKQTFKVLAGFSLLILLAACPEQGISQKVTINQPGTGSSVNRKPIIQQLNANPTNISRKDDIISFKVVAVDEDSDILKYVWSATKGTISSTQGEIVTWMPQKSDGSLEAGTAVISVLVSDNKGGTDTSSVNIRIDASGSAQVQGGAPSSVSPTVMPTTQPSQAPTPQATPSLPVVQPTASATSMPTAVPSEKLIYSNGNIAAVFNNPACRPRFSLSQSTRLTKIINYHWNQAQGDPPGSDGAISLQEDDGTLYGPWKVAATRLGQGGVPNAYWDVFPNQDVPAGNYTVLDSHQATWAQNSGSGGCGMTEIYGYGAAATLQGNLLFNNWNIAYVDNGPTGETRFTLSTPQRISYLDTYHWNYGKGSPGGTLALKSSDGKLFGPWPVTTGPGQGGVPNAVWITRPNQLLPAGTYTVVDSEPSTWSQNDQSGNLGFSRVEGLPE